LSAFDGAGKGSFLASLLLSVVPAKMAVDKLLKKALVGALQRAKIKHWRGLPERPLAYNEGPTSSCHTFCWKARRHSTCLFFRAHLVRAM